MASSGDVPVGCAEGGGGGDSAAVVGFVVVLGDDWTIEMSVVDVSVLVPVGVTDVVAVAAEGAPQPATSSVPTQHSAMRSGRRTRKLNGHTHRIASPPATGSPERLHRARHNCATSDHSARVHDRLHFREEGRSPRV